MGGSHLFLPGKSFSLCFFNFLWKAGLSLFFFISADCQFKKVEKGHLFRATWFFYFHFLDFFISKISQTHVYLSLFYPQHSLFSVKIRQLLFFCMLNYKIWVYWVSYRKAKEKKIQKGDRIRENEWTNEKENNQQRKMQQ